MFIESTLKFVEKSDLSFLTPLIRTITINSDGTESIGISSHLCVNANKLNGNFIVAQTVMFILFDTLIDLKHQNLEGESFKKRYEKLPSNTNIEHIIKESYRIFKIIRNPLTHNRTSAHTSNSQLNISYKNKQKKHNLYTEEFI